MFKYNVRNTEEVATIIEELGLVEKGAEMGKVITNAFITSVTQIENVYEDPSDAMTQKYSKKFPINLALHEDTLCVSQPKLVDMSWQILHTLSSKNLNKIL